MNAECEPLAYDYSEYEDAAMIGASGDNVFRHTVLLNSMPTIASVLSMFFFISKIILHHQYCGDHFKGTLLSCQYHDIPREYCCEMLVWTSCVGVVMVYDSAVQITHFFVHACYIIDVAVMFNLDLRTSRSPFCSTCSLTLIHYGCADIIISRRTWLE